MRGCAWGVMTENSEAGEGSRRSGHEVQNKPYVHLYGTAGRAGSPGQVLQRLWGLAETPVSVRIRA